MERQVSIWVMSNEHIMNRVMSYSIRNTKELRYRAGEDLFAGLVVMESDEDSYELLETYQKDIDAVLDKFAHTVSRSEQEIFNEVTAACVSDIEGLNERKIEEMLEAFTTFFLYDFTSKTLLISRNVVLNGTTVSTEEDATELVDFPSTNDEGTNDDGGNDDGPDGDPHGDDPTPDDKKLITGFITDLKSSVKIVAMIACIASVVWGCVKTYQYFKYKLTIEPPIVIDLNIVNELTTEGRLYVKEDEGLAIKYFVSKNKRINEDAINWNDCSSLLATDTLYPKRNCAIFIRATLASGNINAVRQEMIDFNFNNHIEYLIKTNSNHKRTKELLSYSFNRPLTISYDNTTEDVCEKPTDKGYIDNLITSLREGEYHIDSIAFYSKPEDLQDNITSKLYPQIKYIGCSSN